MGGRIFDIQRFSIHDGPGIRTTIFFQGCPLRCRWCHNPEGWSPEGSLCYDARRCLHCGICADLCPTEAHTQDGTHSFDRAACNLCGTCAEMCPPRALTATARNVTVKEVLDEILPDQAFYGDTGGGVTLSGGEPLMQPDFALKLLQCCKSEGIHTVMQTCGFGSPEALSACTKWCDLFILDIKAAPSQHKTLTGGCYETFERSLAVLSDQKAATQLHGVIVPDVNTHKEHYANLLHLCQNHPNITSLHLTPCHMLGDHKRTLLGLPATGAVEKDNAQAIVEDWAKRLSSHVIVCTD
jgi:pyruvate formate lyase activating enzyme